MYESLYASAQQENADAVFCGFYTEVKKGKWIESNEVLENKVWKGDAVRNFMLDMIASAPYVKQERKYQMSVWHSIYRRAIIKDNNIRFFSEREIASEDIPFQVEFLQKAENIIYINNCYYYYCKNESSLTHTFKIEKFECNKALRQTLLDNTNGKVSKLRIDRYFIGAIRSFIGTVVVSCSWKNRKTILSILVNDNIWQNLRLSYLPQYLPLNSRIFYVLIIHKKLHVLNVYAQLVNFIKRIKYNVL